MRARRAWLRCEQPVGGSSGRRRLRTRGGRRDRLGLGPRRRRGGHRLQLVPGRHPGRLSSRRQHLPRLCLRPGRSGRAQHGDRPGRLRKDDLPRIRLPRGQRSSPGCSTASPTRQCHRPALRVGDTIPGSLRTRLFKTCSPSDPDNRSITPSPDKPAGPGHHHRLSHRQSPYHCSWALSGSRSASLARVWSCSSRYQLGPHICVRGGWPVASSMMWRISVVRL